MAKTRSPYSWFAHEVLDWLLEFPGLQPRTRLIVVGFGRPVDANAPFPITPERLKMLVNIGQRVPLINEQIKGRDINGNPATFDENVPIRYESSDAAAVQIVTKNGLSYANVNAQGSAMITAFADADRTGATRELSVVLGTITGNDPAQEAVVAEATGGPEGAFGTPEPIPAEDPLPQ